MPALGPRRPALAGLLLAVGALAACAAPPPPSVYLNPVADLGSFAQVAVLPLENLTSDRFAAERVREILVVELLAGGVFAPVEVGEVNRVLRVEKIAALDDLGPADMARLGKALNVKALIFGSVMEYTERRVGTLTAPQVAVSLKMIDVETGTTIWSVSDARTGLSTSTRLFGVGEETSSQAVRELLRKLIDEVLLAAGYQ